MRSRRPRNRATEEYVAGKQARYLGKDAKEVLALIDAKGGDYYRSDLHPDQKLIEVADGDFNTYRTGTDAMNQVAEDMRNYYGINKPRVLTNVPDDLQAMVDEVTGPFKGKVSSPASTSDVVVVPVAQEATKEAVDQAVDMAKGGKGGLRKALEAVALADNAVQKAIREKVLYLKDDVAPEKENLRTLLAQTVFRPNRMAPDSYYKASSPGVGEDVATLLAARGLQAGVLAGAVGLGIEANKGISNALEELGLVEEKEKDQGVSPGLMIRY